MNYESQTLIRVTNEDVTEGTFVFPEDITSIGSSAFYGCTGLTTIIIPNSVTFIGDEAFAGCTNLTTINIPSSVTSIDYGAFTGCTALTTIDILNSVTSIGTGVFARCTGLITINIPNSVTAIGISAFDGCTGLTTINIPNNVTAIGSGAFAGCTGLTSINISNSVTSIGFRTFAECTGLTSINIPNSVTAIGRSAFYECTDLTAINISSSVTVIGNEAFFGCTGLTSIHIPSSVTSIDSGAFYRCTGLTTINIPNSITSIGTWAFAECSNLNFIIINTEDKLEFERIKNLLPAELGEKATPPPSVVLNERHLILKEFNAKAYPGSLPTELSMTIFSYDDWSSNPNMVLKKELDNVAIPHSLDDLTQYKRSLNELLERHLVCFDLNLYQEKIKNIASNNSSFFSSNAPVANHSILNICNLIDRLVAIILKQNITLPLSVNEKELLLARPSLLKLIPEGVQQQIEIASPPTALNEEIEILLKTRSLL